MGSHTEKKGTVGWDAHVYQAMQNAKCNMRGSVLDMYSTDICSEPVLMDYPQSYRGF